MENTIGFLCVLSVLSALAIHLTPEGREKSVMRFVCSVVLLAAVFRSVKSPDWEVYSLEAAAYRQREKRFLEASDDLNRQLSRIVIEQEYETYILNKARQMQFKLDDVEITAQWSMDGIWVPYSAVLTGEADEQGRDVFSSILETDLGIPRSRQEWITSGP